MWDQKQNKTKILCVSFLRGKEGKGRRRVFVSVVMIIIIVLMMMKGGANCDSRSFLVDGDRLSGFSIPLWLIPHLQRLLMHGFLLSASLYTWWIIDYLAVYSGIERPFFPLKNGLERLHRLGDPGSILGTPYFPGKETPPLLRDRGLDRCCSKC